MIKTLGTKDNIVDELTNIRLSIIGDDELKYNLLSNTEILDKLTDIIEDNNDFDSLKNSLIIINSLSYLKDFNPSLRIIYGLFNLIEDPFEFDDDEELVKLSLMTLNKLDLKKKIEKLPFPEFEFRDFLSTDSEDDELILHTIKHLIKFHSNDKQIIELIDSYQVLYQHALEFNPPYSNELFYLMDCILINKSLISSLYDDFHLLISWIKIGIKRHKNLVLISNYLNYWIQFQKNNDQDQDDLLQFELNFIKFEILPILLNQKNGIFHNSKAKINPIALIEKISLNFPILNSYLINLNLIEKFLTYLKQNKINKSQPSSNIYNIFFIFSSIASNDEINRNLIISNNDIVLQNIDNILTYYWNVKTQNNQNQIPKSLIQSVISSLYLLRSLSRSISNLRKHLIDLKTPEILIELIKPNSKEPFNISSITLSIISNLILEFSPLRQKFLNLNLIPIIKENLLENFDHQVTLNSLWIVRHLIFNETLAHKEDIVINKLTLPLLFKYLDNDIDITLQEQCFNIFRNFTSSCYESQIYKIFQSYQDFKNYISPRDDNKILFIDTLTLKLSQNFGIQTNESIVYIFGHILKINETLRNEIVGNPPLLKLIYNFLENQSTTDDLKIACVWFIINLTWFDKINNQDNGQGHEEIEESDSSDNTNTARLKYNLRVQKLNDLGFKNVLNKLLNDGSINIDLKERVKTALANLG
ncbi:hypothetical protein WICMUC_002591 [Wickerhamomyces mucosus]|uniref:Armadillo repeat-containing protein 8 n=1 Tax=Wickerhamomyces mucosus TaxID=1378264 RepID=A0A9P8PQV9_9ASCO|nr:hypothetical protein WICMUC_002591 [Wickerhamomyces mucosus]